MILYTLYKNSYIDIAHLESTKGITCYVYMFMYILFKTNKGND